MNAFIRSARTYVFLLFRSFDRYLKCASMSSWVCPTSKMPTVTSLKICFAVSNKQNAITNLFLLSFAELLSCRNNFLNSGTTSFSGSRGRVGSRSTFGIDDMHLNFPYMSALKNKFCSGVGKSTLQGVSQILAKCNILMRLWNLNSLARRPLHSRRTLHHRGHASTFLSRKWESA